MREIRTYGSVGVPGRQLPGSTRQAREENNNVLKVRKLDEEQEKG